ncbi:unnamed protein product, partial [Gadus morhua 'NCC']
VPGGPRGRAETGQDGTVTRETDSARGSDGAPVSPCGSHGNQMEAVMRPYLPDTSPLELP